MFLNGGQAQMDTFDMKPEAPEGIRGPYRPIATSVPGTQISNMLPRLSRLTDRYTILRSASHPLSGHNSSAAYVLSGHTPGNDSSIQPTPNPNAFKFLLDQAVANSSAATASSRPTGCLLRVACWALAIAPG